MAIVACGTPVDPKGSSRLLAFLQLFKTKSTAPLDLHWHGGCYYAATADQTWMSTPMDVARL
ncbi:hypothetical protein BEL01nite_63840 [Bradyrhizobium elkanii]|nr:hypothetical protein BEL01nite_63840 [Bradyrhizobium elkanii]